MHLSGEQWADKILQDLGPQDQISQELFVLNKRNACHMRHGQRRYPIPEGLPGWCLREKNRQLLAAGLLKQREKGRARRLKAEQAERRQLEYLAARAEEKVARLKRELDQINGEIQFLRRLRDEWLAPNPS
jgi:hypothetical protein